MGFVTPSDHCALISIDSKLEAFSFKNLTEITKLTSDKGK